METTLIANIVTWAIALGALFGVFGLVMTGLRTADDEQTGRIPADRRPAEQRRRRELAGAAF
jgi:hypothetical protein